MHAEFGRIFVSLWLDRGHARVIVKACAGAQRRKRKPGNVPRGIQARAGFVHHAAEINVRADFAAQLASWDDAHFVTEFALQERGGFFVAVEVGLLAGNFQVAAAREIAVDIFLAHDVLDAVDGRKRCGVHFANSLASLTVYQCGYRQFPSGEDHGAVAGTGAPAKGLCLEDGHFHPALCKRACRGKAAVARAHNRDVGVVWQISCGWPRGRGQGFEPIIFFFDRHEERQAAQGILASADPREKCTARSRAGKGRNRKTDHGKHKLCLRAGKRKRRQGVTRPCRLFSLLCLLFLKNKIPETLLFVAVEAIHGSDGAEQTVPLAVNARGEKQCVRGSGARVIAKRERPQSVNGQDGVVWILQETHEFVGESVKGGDPTTAEVANQNGIAKLTEITRGPNNSPGCIEPGTMLEMGDVPSSGSKDLNEAQAVACHVIVSGGVLLGISDEEAAADVLNVERCEATGDIFVAKGLFT